MKFPTLLLFALCAGAILRSEELPAGSTPASPAVVAPALRGVRLVPDAAAASSAHDGVEFEAFPLLASSNLRETLGAGLGRPVRITDVEKMVRDIQLAYAKLGYPFVQVTVPPQDITTGRLTFVVREAKLGTIKVEGAKWFSEASYLAALDLAPGQAINKIELNADLDWLGRSGYRRASVQAAPGTSPGTTDLVVQAEEQRPWRFFTSYSDSGTATTDDERVTAGGSWGNAFGRGHELTYQLTTSPDLKTSVANSGSYTIPLNSRRHIFRVDAAWSTIRADIPAPFDSKGYAWQVGLNYEIPLRAWQLGAAGPVQHSMTAGFDFKETNNNIEFSSMPVTDNTTQIVQFRASWQGSLKDRLGSTGASVTGVYSPGGLGSRNNDAAFTGSRSGAQADYVYANVSVRRDTQLPHGFAHVISLTGQVASANLLGSEQLGIGGSNSVRGYDEGLVYGDQGVLLRNEVYLPAFGFAGKLGHGLPPDSVRLLGFWDYGVARSKHLLAGEDPNLILGSVGLGVRYQLGDHFAAQFDYGWQQKDPGFPTRETHGRGHVSVTMHW